jgi:hypothetical protein
LLASAGGTAYRGHSTTGGYQVSILHENGWRTLYLHLKANSYKFSDGQRVEQGQHIADTGNSGTQTSGAHLHYEQQNQIDGRWRAVHAYFNGVPSDITDDARANEYWDTSRNCGDATSTNEKTQSADLDGDGRAEIITQHGNDIWSYRNLGYDADHIYGGFDTRIILRGWQLPTVRFADLNNDGRAEAITQHGNDIWSYRNLGYDADHIYGGFDTRIILRGWQL